MDLGARLRAEGIRLRLDASLLVKHRKRWKLSSIVRTDVVERGIPYPSLILLTGLDDDLNVRKSQPARSMGYRDRDGIGDAFSSRCCPIPLRPLCPARLNEIGPRRGRGPAMPD